MLKLGSNCVHSKVGGNSVGETECHLLYQRIYLLRKWVDEIEAKMKNIKIKSNKKEKSKDYRSINQKRCFGYFSCKIRNRRKTANYLNKALWGTFDNWTKGSQRRKEREIESERGCTHINMIIFIKEIATLNHNHERLPAKKNRRSK